MCVCSLDYNSTLQLQHTVSPLPLKLMQRQFTSACPWIFLACLRMSAPLFRKHWLPEIKTETHVTICALSHGTEYLCPSSAGQVLGSGKHCTLSSLTWKLKHCQPLLAWLKTSLQCLCYLCHRLNLRFPMSLQHLKQTSMALNLFTLPKLVTSYLLTLHCTVNDLPWKQLHNHKRLCHAILCCVTFTVRPKHND